MSTGAEQPGDERTTTSTIVFGEGEFGYVQVRTPQGTIIVQQDVGSGDTSVWCYPPGYPYTATASQLRWGGTLRDLGTVRILD